MLQRPLLVIFAIVLVNLIGFGIIIPLLPFYAEEFGASPFLIGLLFASYSFSQLIASPALGVLSDRYGRRPVLLYSLAGTVVSFAMLALARNLLWLFLARIVDGLSGGNIATVRAYIGDVTSGRDRARAYGLLGAAFGLGFIFGPAIAGALGRFGYAVPAWTAGGLAGMAFLLTWAWLPEPPRRAKAMAAMPTLNLEVVRRPGVGSLLLVDFVYWAIFSVFQTTFALFTARRYGFDLPKVGYLLTGVSAVGIIVQAGLVGPAVRRFGEGSVLAAGLGTAAVGLGAAAVAYSLPFFLIALLPAAVGSAFATPSLISLVSKSAGTEEQGKLQGIANSLESLGRMLGPLWGNGLLGRFGEGTAFLSAAIASLATAAYTWGSLRAGAMVSPIRKQA